MRYTTRRSVWVAMAAGLFLLPTAFVQAESRREEAVLRRPEIIVPQVRIRRPGQVRVTEVNADVTIRGQAAVTELVIALRNEGGRRTESRMLVPVPPKSVVRGFGFDGVNEEMTARVLPRDEARRIYNEIVSRLRDPALLEFAGYNLIRSSAFPLEPGRTRKVRLVYENLLPADGDRIDYVLPRSESLRYDIPWQVSVRVTGKRPISTVYSPSHTVSVDRVNERTVKVRLSGEAARSPGSFRLSVLFERSDGVSASLYAYPDPKVGGGYFLLLAGLPGKLPERSAIKREVTMVIDRSGSMQGQKLRQVKEAALQVLAGLDEGEFFNFLSYNESVSQFADAPVVKNDQNVAAAREYINGLRARGGTNLHDALVESLRQEPTPKTLPIVLFLTDGLPTVGQTSERAIREVAVKGNAHGRRVFTFGVGVDVNTPLLEKVASATRATSTFVLPKEDLEVKVGKVFRNLSGPVLAGATLRVHDRSGEGAGARRVSEMLPAAIPDLFEGDQLIVLGRYKGKAPLDFTLSGNYMGKEKSFAFMFPLDGATTRNAFVPRLWAGRKIAMLESAIRELGADLGLAQSQLATSNDPRLRELVQAVIKLSTEFGILTEYTAFLADEKTDFARREEVLRRATGMYKRRALRDRSGVGAVSQELNLQSGKMRAVLNYDNRYLNKKLERVTISNVQQINDRAFYRRGGVWIDSRLVRQGQKPMKVVRLGDPEYMALAERLAEEHRQGCMALKGEILLEVDGSVWKILNE